MLGVLEGQSNRGSQKLICMSRVEISAENSAESGTGNISFSMFLHESWSLVSDPARYTMNEADVDGTIASIQDNLPVQTRPQNYGRLCYIGHLRQQKRRIRRSKNYHHIAD
jgi:hypothetical protein